MKTQTGMVSYSSNEVMQSRLPPGPKGTIIGGNIRQLRAGPLDFFLSTAREYGPLASFRIGPKRVFLASGPDLIDQVLVTDAKHYINTSEQEHSNLCLETGWLQARARFGSDSAS